MSKGKSDDLFLLIKSLKKSEKRYFKLMSRGDQSGDIKYLLLFDLIDSQNEFDEEAILSKEPRFKRSQFSNLKAHLYKRLLQSVRQYNQNSVIDIQIREMIDYAQLLFNRSLYDQCADILKKAKKKAQKIDNLELLLSILKWEKDVLTQTVGADNQNRVDSIIQEVRHTNERINNVNSFTNLSAKLNSIYVKTGFIRNQTDNDEIDQLLANEMPDFEEEELSLTEKLSLYELYVGYYFFVHDFQQGEDRAKKWVALYDANPELRISRIEDYLNAVNNLMIAQYKLYMYQEFVNTSRRLRELRHYPKAISNENIRMKLLKYTYVHEFNRIFMLGDFKHGVSLMAKIKPRLEPFIDQLDNHSRLILYYKVACLYFGNDNYSDAIQWLNRIFSSENVDLREDIHSFARILNLISHYEMGNMDVIDYFIRSTYRFMLKKDDLYSFQKAILGFLRKLSLEFKQEDLIPEFEKLRRKLIPLQDNPHEKRAFIYFDIISWLESKIQKRSVQEIIAKKARRLFEEQRQVA